MIEIQFTQVATRDFKKLPVDIQKRIGKKLTFFSYQQNPLIFSKPLVNLPPATHRFRIGDYRVAFHIYCSYLILHPDDYRGKLEHVIPFKNVAN